MDYLDETMPYKKKSKRRAPAKAKHKHDFQPCIFEYEGIQFDSAHGVIPKRKGNVWRLLRCMRKDRASFR